MIKIHFFWNLCVWPWLMASSDRAILWTPDFFTPRTLDTTQGFDPTGHSPHTGDLTLQGIHPTRELILPGIRSSRTLNLHPRLLTLQGISANFIGQTPWSQGLFGPAVFVFDNSLPQLVLTSLTFSSPRVFDPLIFWPPLPFWSRDDPPIFLTHYSSPMPSHPQFHQFYWSAVSTHLR